METLKFQTKRWLSFALLATLLVGFEVINAQEELAPDQNPNYKKSRDKYMSIKDSLTKNEGTTVDATYKAIDDMQLKQERKDLRRSNRQDRRMARINNRRYYYTSPYYNNNSLYYGNSRYPYYNNGFGNGCNNGFGNNGFGNYGYGNYGYNNYSPYNNNYYSGCGRNSFGWGLGIGSGVGLGLGLGGSLWLH